MRGLRRYLATDGLMGEVPLWYSLIAAARYLGVPPWELARMPAWWMNVALAAQSAESAASKRRSSNANSG